jgi:threonyl-tRNA synthetase
MIQITLPDGSQREFPGPVTVAEVAASIGPGLAKAALAGKVNGKVVDTSYTINENSPLAIVTAKDADGLEVIRHSTAHLLAYAVKELFPDAQVTIGPVIEHGFYYDFAYKRPFTPEDLAAIEKRMAELAAKDEPVTRRVLPRDEAVAHFKSIGEHYKAEIIGSIPQGEEVSLYREGGFEDLCRGPHVPSTGKLKLFKLMKVAGAYWRGDHRNEMLQRIYGTAWASKEELQQYLTMLEGSREARPPQARPRTRPVPHRRRRARRRVLAPQGLGHLAGGGAIHAGHLPRHRVPGGEGPADPGPQPVGENGPLAELPREHVHDGERKARLRAQAHELPGPRADLQAGHQELPRPAAALRRVRPVPPQRAPRARCTGSCGCAASPRTTGTSSARKTRSSRNASITRRSCRRCTGISALPTSSTRWRRARTTGSARTSYGTRPSMP